MKKCIKTGDRVRILGSIKCLGIKRDAIGIVMDTKHAWGIEVEVVSARSIVFQASELTKKLRTRRRKRVDR